jgi:hypothetical protein
MTQERPLNFLWRRATLDHVLESHFMREVLLGEIGRPLRIVPYEDGQPLPLAPDTLIGSHGLEAVPLIAEARARGLENIGLFHMADEQGTEDRSFYGNADYVIRHYWFAPAMASPSERSLGVIWVPNGYRNGAGPINPARQLGIAERTIIGFFAGAMSGRLLAGQRDAMLNAVRDARLPFTVLTTPGFGQGLGVVAYAAWLCNSRFALVPAGNSHETIRLYDALEAGAMPIMVRSPFTEAATALAANGTPPFVFLDSWSELASVYAPYADADAPATIARLEEQRQAVVKWWSDFKRRQQVKVRDLIDRSFARGRG